MSWRSKAGTLNGGRQKVPLKRLRPTTTQPSFSRQNLLDDFKPWMQTSNLQFTRPAALNYLPALPLNICAIVQPTLINRWTAFADTASPQQLAQTFPNFHVSSQFSCPWEPVVASSSLSQPQGPYEAQNVAPLSFAYPQDPYKAQNVAPLSFAYHQDPYKAQNVAPLSFAYPQNKLPPTNQHFHTPLLSLPTNNIVINTIPLLPNQNDQRGALSQEPDKFPNGEQDESWEMLLNRFLSWRPKKWAAADFDMHRVLDRLFIGDMWHAENPALLKENGIDMVVCCVMKEERKGRSLSASIDGIESFHVSVLDRPHENIQRFFHAVNVFIHRGRSTGRGVLVHCVKGVSRSATLVIAYLMVACSLSHREAYAVLKKIRLRVKPNDGFLRQLASIEKDLRVMSENLRMEVPFAIYPDSDQEECSRILSLLSPTQ